MQSDPREKFGDMTPMLIDGMDHLIKVHGPRDISETEFAGEWRTLFQEACRISGRCPTLEENDGAARLMMAFAWENEMQRRRAFEAQIKLFETVVTAVQSEVSTSH